MPNSILAGANVPEPRRNDAEEIKRLKALLAEAENGQRIAMTARLDAEAKVRDLADSFARTEKMTREMIQREYDEKLTPEREGRQQSQALATRLQQELADSNARLLVEQEAHGKTRADLESERRARTDAEANLAKERRKEPPKLESVLGGKGVAPLPQAPAAARDYVHDVIERDANGRILRIRSRPA